MEYIKRFIEKHRYGPWKGILIGYLVLCGVSGVMSAWNSRHFLPSFVLWTCTHLLYLPVMAACLGLSIWPGVLAEKSSKLPIIGWIVGIAAFFIVSVFILYLVGEIPGIGWRFKVILSSSNDDY
ncbi:hypothetical protein [Pseudomonas syringae]|uniref:hypothetical protein n=1 Tax=Pseudomonas syringae TaxID=317 RepID=UPI001179EE63|nr:hypothetical protein [Pseudomonas syringae]